MKRYVFLFMLFIISASYASNLKKDTVYVENNYSKDVLEYSKFLREETKAYSEFVDSIYQRIIYFIAGGTILISSIIVFLGWNSKKLIQKQIKKYYQVEIQKVVGDQNKDINKNIDYCNDKIYEYTNLIEDYKRELDYLRNLLIIYLAPHTGVKNKISVASSINNSDNILWICENIINHESIFSKLKELRLEIDKVTNVNLALECMGKKQYSIIITTMVLGTNEKAGLEIVKRIKKNYREIPIIIFTDQKSVEKNGEEAIALGVVCITSIESELLTVISKYLDFGYSI